MVLTLIEDSMTIIGQRDADQDIRIIPGGLISSKNGSELYSVAAIDGEHPVLFPTSRYYYLGTYNIIYENHGYALSIPPRYQFLKVVQDEGRHVLRFCDRNGKLLTVGDFNPLDDKDARDTSRILGALERANVPTVTSMEKLAADNSALGNIEYVASQDLKDLVQPDGNQPSFALGPLGEDVSVAHMFPLKPFEPLPIMTPETTVGALNSEYASLMLDHGSGSVTFSYFSPALKYPAYVRIEPAKYQQETISAVKSALLEHPLYLVVEGRAFSISRNAEGAIMVRNDQQARRLLQQANLLPDDGDADENAFDILGGRYALRITVGDTLLSPEEVQHEFENLPGILSNVAVSVQGAEIPLPARTHGGDLLLFRDFTLEHIAAGKTDGSGVPEFREDLTKLAFEALIKNNFALRIPATDSGELPYINVNGQPIAGRAYPLQALTRSAEYPAGAGDSRTETGSTPTDTPQTPQPDEAAPPRVATENAPENAGDSKNGTGSTPTDSPQTPQPDEAAPPRVATENAPGNAGDSKNGTGSTSTDSPQTPQPGVEEHKVSTGGVVGSDPDAAFVGDDPRAYQQNEQKWSVIGTIAPREILFDAQTGMRKHSVVLELHNGDEHALPTRSYRFGQDEQLIARDIWGHKVVIPEEYRYLKVALHEVGGKPQYRLSFCDKSGKIPDAQDLARYYQGSNSLPDDLRALLNRGVVPDIIANPQFVTSDVQGISLKDLYDAQGHSPAIALVRHPGVSSVLGHKFTEDAHAIVGKLASSLAYFDFSAHPYYTHLFHYDDNTVEVPPANPGVIPDAAALASQNMLLVLGQEGFFYVSGRDPSAGNARLVDSPGEYLNFLTQAALVLNGKPAEISQPLALKFQVGQAITDSRNDLGGLYPVYALVGEKVYYLEINDGNVLFSRNMLELAYIPKAGSPSLLCADSMLGQEVIRKALHEPISFAEEKTSHNPHFQTHMIVHGNKVVVRNAADALFKVLPQGVDTATHHEDEPISRTPEPAPVDDLQPPHTAGGDANRDGGERSSTGTQHTPPSEVSTNKTGDTSTDDAEHAEMLSLPFGLGARIEDGKGRRYETFQVVLRVQKDASGAENPALPTSGYISKNGEIIHINKLGGYALALIPEHRFLKVVKVFENGEEKYKLALCDATGRPLTPHDFTKQSAASATEGAPTVGRSYVFGDYTTFLQDDHALCNTGQVVVAGANGTEVAVDLEDVYNTQGYLPYFKLEASESGRVLVKHNGYDTLSDRPMFLSGEYALFEFDPVSYACTLSLSNKHSASSAGPAIQDIELTLTPADQQYSSEMAWARTQSLERKPLYASVDGTSLKFTATPAARVVEDPWVVEQFMRRISDLNYHDDHSYSVRIVALDKYDAGLQGMGIRIGSQTVEIPITREDGSRIGFPLNAPIKIAHTDSHGKKSTQSVPDLQHDVLSEFLSRQVSLVVGPSGRERIVAPTGTLLASDGANAQGEFLSSLIAHNMNEIVGRSVNEFVAKVRNVRHAGVGGEHGTDDLSPTQKVPDTKDMHPHDVDEPNGRVVETLRLYLDRDAQQAPFLFGVAARYDDDPRVAPKVSYSFTRQGELIAYMGPSLFKVLDARYVKVVQLQDDEYALRLCDAEGQDLDREYSNVDAPVVIPDSNIDWELDEIYESTEGKPAFTLHMGHAGPSGHAPVVLVPTPENHLSEDYHNTPVAHLSTGFMVFIVGSNQVTLLHRSVVDSARANALVWDLHDDETGAVHNTLLQRASDAHPLYLVVRAGEVAWTLDKDATDLEFTYDPRVMQWLRKTWLGNLDQATLQLTIVDSKEDPDSLRLHVLVLGDTPEALEQPEGEELYFDKTTYSVQIRDGGAIRDVHTDAALSLWRTQMLAAVVPEVFSLEVRSNDDEDSTTYHVVRNADERETSDIAQDFSPEHWHMGQPSLLQAIQEYDALLLGPGPRADVHGPDAHTPTDDADEEGGAESGYADTGARGMSAFDAKQWGPDTQRLVFVEESTARDHRGDYTLWINVEYENMVRFHANVNAKYRSWEYTYEEAIELYNSITTEGCRHQSNVFPVINGGVDPNGQVTVGGYSFGGIEALHKMFELT
ncbi:RodZ family helix-turn-helix domain-containing protein [Anaplasma marginale]|uniref:hypothetical protein n=1 Tax=Anaplasma marginale TaxID=770 RepID=UPI00068066E1|nr:hypothetical protein [Anaplasma marginale]